LTLLLLLVLAACARQSQEPGTDELAVTLAVTPDPPVVGPATLVITLKDAAGSPVNDALLNVKGDMSHAGMQPVLAEVEGGVDGVYEVPFRWTMGGDWFVTVDATLADGRTLSRRFDLNVSGGMGMDMGG
jgi:hypothetical protein